MDSMKRPLLGWFRVFIVLSAIWAVGASIIVWRNWPTDLTEAIFDDVRQYTHYAIFEENRTPRIVEDFYRREGASEYCATLYDKFDFSYESIRCNIDATLPGSEKNDSDFKIPNEFVVPVPTSRDLGIAASVCEYPDVSTNWMKSKNKGCRLELYNRLPESLVEELLHADRARWLVPLFYLRDWIIVWLLPLVSLAIAFMLGAIALKTGKLIFCWITAGFRASP